MKNYFYYYEPRDNRHPSEFGWKLELSDTTKLQPVSKEIDDEVNENDTD